MAKKGKKKWLIVAVSLLLGVMAGGAIGRAVKGDVETLKARHYEVGMINSAGEDVEQEKDAPLSFRTKDFIEYNELNISFDKEAEGYRAIVFFYDEDEEFLATMNVGEGFDVEEFDWDKREEYRVESGSALPEDVIEYVRVMVMLPEEEDEDGEISIFELWGYQRNVTISYEKAA